MVANRRFSPISVAILFIFFVSNAMGQDAAVQGEDAPPSKAYYFSFDETGSPVFTQVIAWTGDPNALGYEIVVRDASGATLVDERVAESSLLVQLRPGNYTYKIITYNLLGKSEVQTDWIDMRVIKAERPVIAGISPDTLYMDTMDRRIAIAGENLLDEGDVTLISEEGEEFVGKITGRVGDNDVAVVFPNEAYQPGLHSIRFRNPGGLFATQADALVIKPQKPLDILVSVGYSPLISLYDEWFLQNWSDTFNPIAASTQLSAFFVKKRWGFLGTELEFQWWRLYGGFDGNTITSDFALVSISLAYKLRFTRSLHGVVKAGGGFSRSYHSFDYDGFQGPTTDSWDPYAKAGVALQFFTTFKLFTELGFDWSSVFFEGDQLGGIVPKLSVGYQLY